MELASAVRARRRTGWILILIGGFLTAGAGHGAILAAPAEGLVLRAEAGLGGFARAGRWTPVRLDIRNNHEDVSGEVVVEWGDARLHRAVEIPAPSRTVIELYVRTLDVRGSIAVRLVADGQPVAGLDVPIRVLSDEEALVVCAGMEAAEPGVSPCATTMAPEALPLSIRGYVAADEVRLQPGAESRLTARQRTALQRWRAYDERERRSPVQAPKAPIDVAAAAGVGRSMAVAAAVVIVSFLCVAWIWMGGHGPAWVSYVALLGGAALGVVGGVSAGRFGPGAEILVRHATTVEQIGDGALVTIRATVEYPAFAAYAIRATGVDGDLTRRPAATSEHWLDADGTPLRRGTFGRGMRDEVEVDGVIEYAPFRVQEEGDVVSVLNTSQVTLTDCSFPEGYSGRSPGTLAPGQSASARALASIDSPFFSCVCSQPPVTFSDLHFPVRMRGVAVVSVRLPIGRRDEAGEI